MTSIGVLLVLLAPAWPKALWADIAPEPGSPEWIMQKSEEDRSCEPGEETVECMPRLFIDPASPFCCDRLDADPVNYPLSSLKYISRYCKSAPDLPKECLNGDSELACSAVCRFTGECAAAAPSCVSYLHSDRYYRIRKRSGTTLFYCGPNSARTAEFRTLSEQWGRALEDCARLNSKSAPQALSCGKGETERECEDAWPRNPESCAPFKGRRAYYELPARASSPPYGQVKHVYCKLSWREALRMKGGFKKCVEEALKKRRPAAPRQ